MRAEPSASCDRMDPQPSCQASELCRVPRRVLCSHYGRCLDLAILRGWQGFTCSRCRHYLLEDIEDPAWWEAQADRCRVLLAKVEDDRWVVEKGTIGRRKTIFMNPRLG